MKNDTLRDGNCKSAWQHGLSNVPNSTTAATDTVYDCLVVGGGITGFTTALLAMKWLFCGKYLFSKNPVCFYKPGF